MLDHYHMKFHILLHNFECHDITEMTAKVGVKHQRNQIRTERGPIGPSVTVIFTDKIKLLILLQFNLIQNRT
jgi:hypothetical protein